MIASASDILRFRLASQRIAPSAGGSDVAAVVRHLFAVQAQDFGQAVWALGQRIPGSTRVDVAEALASGRVIRSWPMRGTLHFIDPADVRWMLRLTATRTISSLAARYRDLGLDDDTFRRAADVAVDALGGGRSIGRDGLTAVLENAGISTTGQRGPHLIGHLAQTAVICWGPPDGTRQAIVLLDEWAPETSIPDRDQALRDYVLRYIVGHGPATIRDFAWWSKLTLADSRRGLDLARDDLVEVVHENTSYWMTPETADAASARPSTTVHALPGFDEYLLGYQNRSHSLAIEFASRIVPGGNGVFLPMIVSRGRVVGAWRRSVGQDRITVRAMPFEPLGQSEAAGFEREAARYGKFHGLPVDVRWERSLAE